MRTITPLAIALIAGAAITTGCNSPDRAERAELPTTGATFTAPDFVRNAASSNMFEIESSQLALERSQNSQVRNVAQQMIRDHQHASQQLEAAADQLDIPVPDDMLPRHQQMVAQLRDARGADFDRLYLEMQDKAHAEAVQLFERASDEIADPRLREFAQGTVPTLRQHHDHVNHTQQALFGGGQDAAIQPASQRMDRSQPMTQDQQYGPMQRQYYLVPNTEGGSDIQNQPSTQPTPANQPGRFD